ncbi:MAG: hypothetical protein GXO78_14975 [Calditrichaeota bacterium]|nr:hypothetical protein [Calditrichota bacterium]
MKKVLVFLVTLAVLAAFSVNAFACEGKGKDGKAKAAVEKTSAKAGDACGDKAVKAAAEKKDACPAGEKKAAVQKAAKTGKSCDLEKKAETKVSVDVKPVGQQK